MKYYKFKIYGAGSIGAHFTNQLINYASKIDIYDLDKTARKRFKNNIFKKRYKYWSNKINILENDDTNEKYNLVIIGTPPNSHLTIAKKILKSKHVPDFVHIEKPLSGYKTGIHQEFLELFKNKKTKFHCGYNHLFTKNTIDLISFVRKNINELPINIDINWNESWNGIMAAHPWLQSPSDTYLGNIKHGGGALFEHSHCLNFLVFLVNELNLGKISTVFCKMQKKVNLYNCDLVTKLIIQTNKEVLSTISTDVISDPPEKNITIKFKNFLIKWFCNYSADSDRLEIYKNGKKYKIKKYKKERSDDFKNQTIYLIKSLKNIKHYEKKYINMAIETQYLLQKSVESNKLGKEIKVGSI